MDGLTGCAVEVVREDVLVAARGSRVIHTRAKSPIFPESREVLRGIIRRAISGYTDNKRDEALKALTCRWVSGSDHIYLSTTVGRSSTHGGLQ